MGCLAQRQGENKWKRAYKDIDLGNNEVPVGCIVLPYADLHMKAPADIKY